jgi:hypothetical protein
VTPVGRAVQAVATRLGVTEGQVYTAVIGGAVAVAAAIGGIPPTLAERRAVPGETPRVTTSAPAIPTSLPPP